MNKTYVLSDIHGNFNSFKAMLNKIDFSQSDQLYIIGDVLDRGENPIELIEFIMKFSNIHLILGNHELFACILLPLFLNKIDTYNYNNFINEEKDILIYNWIYNGGQKTINGFLSLNYDDQVNIINYLHSCKYSKKLFVNNTNYLLAHSHMPVLFNQEKSDYLYNLKSTKRLNYDLPYINNAILISGHTHTCFIDCSNIGTIFQNDFHIALDCNPYNLGCLCLETKKEFYIKY